MSDLYRIDSQRADHLEWSLTGGLPDPLSHLVDEGVLIKVEPCEHGNYAHHAVIEMRATCTGGEDWRFDIECDGTPEATDV